MHLPDGFLDTRTWIGIVGDFRHIYHCCRAQGKQNDIGVAHPLLGYGGLYLCRANVQFSRWRGTSGHFMGATLIAILLGPWASVLIMTTVLFVQCLVFQDGGITTLAANIFNMGVVGGFLGYYVNAAVQSLCREGEVFLSAASRRHGSRLCCRPFAVP